MKTDTSDLATELAAYAHGRVPRELRLRHVLAEAEGLFVERGYHGASMDELATRVGVSKPVIYDLVGSKEQMFHTLMTRAADDLGARVSAAVDAAGDAHESLTAGALAFFTWVGERHGVWLVLLAGDSTPVADAGRTIRRRQAELIADLLAAGAENLQVPVEPLQIEAAAHAINGAFESLAVWWQDHLELSAADVTALLTALIGPGLDVLGGA